MNQPNFSCDIVNNNYQDDSLLNTQAGVSLDTDMEMSNEPLVINNEAGLDFIFNFAENVPQEIRDNIGKAAQAWGEVITDDQTVEINIGFELETAGLANANSETVEVSYSEFRQALSEKSSSESDAIALENLPEAEAFSLLINNTRENQGSDDVYLDDNGSVNNSTISVNRSTAKALGLDLGEGDSDGTILFEQSVNWDYDASDGVPVNAVDFVNVAAHEIGHILGFISTADGLDRVAGQNLKQLIASGDAGLEEIAEALELEVEELTSFLEQFGIGNIAEIDSAEEFTELIAGTPFEPLLESVQPDIFVSENLYIASALDLFRYSDLSSDLGVIDFTTGESEKYFSIDGGNTAIAQLSTGEFLGDGRQLSHWKDDLGLGILDPTYDVTLGSVGSISQNDLQALDVIGWDVV